MSGSRDFTVRANGIIVNRNSHGRILAYVQVERSAGSDTTIIVGNRNCDDVRVVLSRKLVGGENRSQRDNKLRVNFTSSGEIIDVRELTNRIIERIVVNSPIIVSKCIRTGTCGIIEVSHQKDNRGVTNDSITHDLDGRVVQHRKGSTLRSNGRRASMDGNDLHLVIIGTSRRANHDGVKVVTRDLNTILIPNISIRIGTRYISLDGSLRTLANSSIVIQDRDRRSGRSLEHCDGDGTCGGASTRLRGGGGGHRVSSRGGRGNIHRVGIGVVDTIGPSVGNVTSPLLSVGGQSNSLASANSGGGSHNDEVSANGVNGEVVRDGGTTMLAGSDHRVNARTNLDRFGSSTRAPLVGVSTRSGSRDSGLLALADGVGTRDGQVGRSSFNFHDCVSRKLGRTTLGAHSTNCELMIANLVQSHRQSSQVLTLNLNTVVIPNIMVSIGGGSGKGDHVALADVLRNRVAEGLTNIGDNRSEDRVARNPSTIFLLAYLQSRTFFVCFKSQSTLRTRDII